MKIENQNILTFPATCWSHEQIWLAIYCAGMPRSVFWQIRFGPLEAAGSGSGRPFGFLSGRP